MTLDLKAWKVQESGRIGGDNRSPCRGRCRCDEEIVRPAWRALPAHVHKQTRMHLCDLRVIGHHGNRPENVVDERRPRRSGLPHGK